MAGLINLIQETIWFFKLCLKRDGMLTRKLFSTQMNKDTTQSTFHQRGLDCVGGKHFKERIIVSLCASMIGEKMKPLEKNAPRRE